MSEDSVQDLYSEDFDDLAELIFSVERPGSFYAQGCLELPMPSITVRGVGPLSMPLPVEQAEKLIGVAKRAPYGKGEKTIVNTEVRKVWQLSNEEVTIQGRSWLDHLQKIVSCVSRDLGCEGIKVEAELYKLLLYDTGGFFLSHRDTEKSPGMFGTLVVVFPSRHRGGELIIRHAGQEVVIDMSGGEASELLFTAFYADCEHEVKPVVEGYRLCVVYNLIDKKQGKDTKTIQPPIYTEEIKNLAELLKQAFDGKRSPTKIAWLLEHQYTPAQLSFEALKNVDAARAQLFQKAAAKADCSVHLGIVHLRESGSAEPDDYRGYEYYNSPYAAAIFLRKMFNSSYAA